MPKGGKRIGAGRPRKVTENRFLLDPVKGVEWLTWLLEEEEKPDPEDSGWVLIILRVIEDVNECRFCAHNGNGSDPWNEEKCTKKCVLNNPSKFSYKISKIITIRNLFEAFLGKKYFCVICQHNHSTKHILYRCDYQDMCDIFPQPIQDSQYTPESMEEVA